MDIKKYMFDNKIGLCAHDIDTILAKLLNG